MLLWVFFLQIYFTDNRHAIYYWLPHFTFQASIRELYDKVSTFLKIEQRKACLLTSSIKFLIQYDASIDRFHCFFIHRSVFGTSSGRGNICCYLILIKHWRKLKYRWTKMWVQCIIFQDHGWWLLVMCFRQELPMSLYKEYHRSWYQLPYVREII